MMEYQDRPRRLNPQSLAAALARLEAQFVSPNAQSSSSELSTPPPRCETCGDTGYVKFAVPVGDARFGKLYPCPDNCEIVAANRAQRTEASLRRIGAFNAQLGTWTFAEFLNLLGGLNTTTAAGKRGGFAAAVQFARCLPQPWPLDEAAQYLYQQNWPNGDKVPRRSVVLFGEPGVGKTGLAAAVVNDIRFRATGVSVAFVRLSDLLANVQSTYSPDSEVSTKEAKAAYANAEILVLDELGLEAATADRKQILEDILRARLSAGGQHPTPFFITTNLTLEEAYNKFGARTGEVLAMAHWVEVGGVNLRPKAKGGEKAW